MTDLYSELLVKKEQTVKDKVIKILMIAGIALTAVAGLIIPFAWILTLALGIAAYLILPKLDLEFEYVFVNGSWKLIDYVQGKRKRVKSFDLAKMDIMAPVNSHRLEYQNHNTKAKTLDFSSGNASHKVFAMFIPDEKELYKVLIEPDAQLIENIQKSCPRKVFLD